MVIGAYLVVRSFAATQTCTTTLSAGADIGTAVSNANGGAIICLGAGSYPELSVVNVSKSSMVTVEPVTGASVTVADVSLNGATNITVTGLTYAGGLIKDAKNVTVSHNTITGITNVPVTISNSNIVIDGNDVVDVPHDGCCGFEGAFFIYSQVSGLSTSDPAPMVTVKNNTFHGGTSDGIQTGGSISDVLITNNEFYNKKVAPCSGCSDGYYHVDPIQIVGGDYITIQNNYFHDDSTGVMEPEGGNSGIVISNNVFSHIDQFGSDIGYKPGIQMVHNTFDTQGLAAYRITDNHVNSSGSTNNVVFRDNACTQSYTLTAPYGSPLFAVNDYNVGCGNQLTTGTHDLTSLPTFSGGAHPSSLAGFALTSASPGYHAASDGTDMGANIALVGPNAGSGGSSDTTPPTVSLTAPANNATVSGSAVTVSANASDDTGVVGVQFKLDGTNLGSEDTTSPYSTTWNTTTASNGTHTLTAVARDAAGNSTTASTVTVTVNNTCSPKPGDFNNDCSVNAFDLSMLLSNWNKNAPTEDLNNDGIVNVFDLSKFLTYWGS